MSLRKALRAALEAKKISASDLARQSKVCRVTISLVSTGKRSSFSKDAAPKIHAALGGVIPLAALLGMPEQPARRASGAGK